LHSYANVKEECHACFPATNTISKFLRGLHEGSVFSVCVMKEGNLVTGGGKDGRLVQLDASLNPTGQETRVPEHLGMLFLITVHMTLWKEYTMSIPYVELYFKL
jgi:hypothetical protein